MYPGKNPSVPRHTPCTPADEALQLAELGVHEEEDHRQDEGCGGDGAGDHRLPPAARARALAAREPAEATGQDERAQESLQAEHVALILPGREDALEPGLEAGLQGRDRLHPQGVRPAPLCSLQEQQRGHGQGDGGEGTGADCAARGPCGGPFPVGSGARGERGRTPGHPRPPCLNPSAWSALCPRGSPRVRTTEGRRCGAPLVRQFLRRLRPAGRPSCRGATHPRGRRAAPAPAPPLVLPRGGRLPSPGYEKY